MSNPEANERRMDALSRRLDYLEERLEEAEETIEILERQKAESIDPTKPWTAGGGD